MEEVLEGLAFNPIWDGQKVKKKKTEDARQALALRGCCEPHLSSTKRVYSVTKEEGKKTLHILFNDESIEIHADCNVDDVFYQI